MSQSSTEYRSDRSPIQEGQLAPHSVEAEENVLGAVLLNEGYMADCAFLKPGEFFIVRHGWIWEAMQTVRGRGDAVDHLTVTVELEERGRLSEVGGAAYLIGLISKTVHGMNVESHAKIVQRLAVRRGLIDAAQVIAREAHSDETDIDTTIANSQAALAAATSAHIGDDHITSALDYASVQFDRVSAVASGRAVPPNCLPTGLDDLDQRIGGLRPDDLIVVAARPGMGKSSWLNQIVMTNAKAGKAVGVANFEMSSAQAVTRMMSSESGVPFQAIQDEKMSPDQTAAYASAFVNSSGWLPRVKLEDRMSVATVEGLRRVVGRMVFEHGIELLVVDYLQRMRAPGFKKDNRVQEVGYLARGLKDIAKEFHIPVVAAAQLSRSLEQRTDKRPILSDLRESGEIEQESDLVMFIYRDEYYDADTTEGHRGEIGIAKHRNGPTGQVDFIWNGSQFRFDPAVARNVDLDAGSVTKSNASIPPEVKARADAKAARLPEREKWSDPLAQGGR